MSDRMGKHAAAWINAVAEEGTRGELIKYLHETWDQLCDLEAEHKAQGSKLHQLSEDHSHCEELLHELGARASSAESRLEEYQKLCPNVKDLDAGEMVDGMSTATVGVGWLTKLMADHDTYKSRLSSYQKALEEIRDNTNEEWAAKKAMRVLAPVVEKRDPFEPLNFSTEGPREVPIGRFAGIVLRDTRPGDPGWPPHPPTGDHTGCDMCDGSGWKEIMIGPKVRRMPCLRSKTE